MWPFPPIEDWLPPPPRFEQVLGLNSLRPPQDHVPIPKYYCASGWTKLSLDPWYCTFGRCVWPCWLAIEEVMLMMQSCCLRYSLWVDAKEKLWSEYRNTKSKRCVIGKKQSAQYKAIIWIMVCSASKESDCDQGHPWYILLVVGYFSCDEETDEMRRRSWNCHDGDFMELSRWRLHAQI